MTTTIAVTVDASTCRAIVRTTMTAGTTVEVQRSADGGSTWDAVRGNSPDDWTLVVAYDDLTAAAPDAEAPLDVPLLYRARANDAAASVLDAWVVSGIVLVPSPPGGSWLLTPLAYPAYTMR